MDDIYAAILGEPPTDQEKLAQLARHLRGQVDVGRLFQATGDRVVGPTGASMMNQATGQAENIGRRGEQARYRKYQEGASARMDERERAEQAWRERDAIAERALRRELEAARNATVLEAAKIRESDGGKKKWKPMTYNQLQDATNKYLDAKNFQSVVNSWDDSYSLKIPGARVLTNALAAKVPILTTESAEKAQSWWASFNNTYTLPERNRLFGATLTDNEQAEWKRNAINENMSAKQIREKLKWYNDKVQEKIPVMKRNLLANNYDPELIETIFSDLQVEAPEEGVVDLPPRS